MIRTLIIDDEKPARVRLRNLLENISDIEITDEASNGLQAIDKIQSLQPDLILLDIQLKDMTGFEVLDQLSKKYTGQIVFITAYNEFAIKAFEHNALDYLLKPFKELRFLQSIDRVRQRIATKSELSIDNLLKYIENKKTEKENHILKIVEGKKSHRIDLGKVTYIKADGYYINIHGLSTKRIIRVPLKEVEKSLSADFVRINRSIIINKQKIEWVKQLKQSVEVQLLTGEIFMVSKAVNGLI